MTRDQFEAAQDREEPVYRYGQPVSEFESYEEFLQYAAAYNASHARQSAREVAWDLSDVQRRGKSVALFVLVILACHGLSEAVERRF